MCNKSAKKTSKSAEILQQNPYPLPLHPISAARGFPLESGAIRGDVGELEAGLGVNQMAGETRLM